MLPDELTEEGILKAPSKYINIWNDEKQPQAGWEEQTINDKIFLLSPAEMGKTGHKDEEPNTTVYSCYKDATNNDRIKRQVKGTEGARTKYITVESGSYTNNKYSYAGYNDNSKSHYGCPLWLRSPDLDNGNYSWRVNYDGTLMGSYVFARAFAVAPAFCI